MRIPLIAVLALSLVACSGSSDDSDESAEGVPAGGIGEGIGDGETPGTGSDLNADGTVPSAAPAADMATGSPATVTMADGSMVNTGEGSVTMPDSAAAESDDGESSSVELPPEQVQASAGVLTAGAWDDNLNFERFLEYYDEQSQAQLPGLLPFTESEYEAAHELVSDSAGAKTTLDISLVIDTTGSMGDELRYLQTEFVAISSTIADLYPDSKQRWSLVVYRDESDPYVARWFDFSDDSEEFRADLAEQSAGGGGDYPEASAEALEVMNQLAWRTGDGTARIAFWVADAPHHDEAADQLADAIRGAQELDIHVYPVASSGVDELTELSMRSAAQLTGGRYLFLTDDSGVGGAHKEPSIPCYFVTKLDDAILRMVDIEMTGEYREPDASEVIRTGGDPQEGACELASGKVVNAF